MEDEVSGVVKQESERASKDRMVTRKQNVKKHSPMSYCAIPVVNIRKSMVSLCNFVEQVYGDHVHIEEQISKQRRKTRGLGETWRGK